MKHLTETELALMAGDDCRWLESLRLGRHLRDCAECQEQVELFSALRREQMPLPELDWNSLALEMRANIRLGLEAGECVRRMEPAHAAWNLRFGAAFACLALLVFAGVWLRPGRLVPVAAGRVFEAPRLESTNSGLEVRTGLNRSLMLLNHEGSVVSQSVSAQGAIRARNIDGNTGSVTINNVYLE